MNLDKAKKRIAKKVKMGFQGYPEISIAYLGLSENEANEVVVKFVAEENSDLMEQRFLSKTDAREDEVIQSTLVKIIERSDAKTVSVAEGVALKT